MEIKGKILLRSPVLLGQNVGQLRTVSCKNSGSRMRMLRWYTREGIKNECICEKLEVVFGLREKEF